MTLSLTKTISFDSREELQQENPIKITSDEIVTEHLIKEEQLNEIINPNDAIPKTIQDKRDINLVKFSDCDNLVKETALCENINQPIIVDTTANVSSHHGMMPPIPIVVCTVSDCDPKCMDVDNSEDDYGTDVRLAKNLNILTTTDEKCIPQEELSPTTDEYQECCPPADYQYDISTEGEIVAPGCVAPAPTPAPSIAPLAEVEVDPPEDELETEEMESVHVSEPAETTGEANANVKKEADGTNVVEKDVVETQCEESQCRNAVCPWEDE